MSNNKQTRMNYFLDNMGDLFGKLKAHYVNKDDLKEDIMKYIDNFRKLQRELSKPLELILNCPECKGRHIDEGEFADKVHHTHACQHCGFVWRPAVEPTVGVQFLEGFKNV